jgi:hypothetical protein
MRLNHTLEELNSDDFEQYGEGRYWITLMGEPHASEPWGWQLEGHHLVINYFVLSDQVVMTPTFMGSEPVSATAGKHKGTVVLQREQSKGLALVNALDEALRRKPSSTLRSRARATWPRHSRTTSSSTTPARARRTCSPRSGTACST